MTRPQRNRILPALGMLVLGPVLLAACSGSAPTAPAAGDTSPQATAPKEVAKPDYSKQYSDMWKVSEHGPVIPELADGVVPQGLAYWPEKNWLIISNYKDTGAASVLTFVDAKTEAAVKKVALEDENGVRYTGHAGGVAVSGKHAWISSGGNVFWIPLQVLADAKDGSTVRFAGRFTTGVRASFASYAEGILWVGEFYSPPDYPTDPSHRLMTSQRIQYGAWAEGYVLDKATDLVPAGKESPDYVFAIPEKIQGMAVTPDSVILSQSYGRTKDSNLLKYQKPDLNGEPHQTVTVKDQQVPVWFLDRKNQDATLKAPPMTEGVITDGGNRLYVLFESGAKTYRPTALSPMDRLHIVRLDEWTKIQTK